MDNKAIDGFKTLLEQRRAELEELRDVSADGREPVTLDQQSVGRVSRVDAMQQQAMAQAQERQRGHELVRIEQALARIEEGEFGWCRECGEEIPAKRLTIDPAAPLCVQCAGR
jgi:DnaK suppressor protein